MNICKRAEIRLKPAIKSGYFLQQQIRSRCEITLLVVLIRTFTAIDIAFSDNDLRRRANRPRPRTAPFRTEKATNKTPSHKSITSHKSQDQPRIQGSGTFNSHLSGYDIIGWLLKLFSSLIPFRKHGDRQSTEHSLMMLDQADIVIDKAGISMDKMGETDTRPTNDADLWLWELAYHKPKKKLSPFMP